MSGPARFAATLAGLLVGGCLAGCGVQPTGVQPAGPAPGGLNAPPSYRYFVFGDRVRPVPPDDAVRQALLEQQPGPPLSPADGPQELPDGRRGDLPPSVELSLAVRELAFGPGQAERLIGASTAVPKDPALAKIQIADASVVLFVAQTDLAKLSPLALLQLSCTVTSVRRGDVPNWSGTVTVANGPEGRQRQAPPCPEPDLTAPPVSGVRARG